LGPDWIVRGQSFVKETRWPGRRAHLPHSRHPPARDRRVPDTHTHTTADAFATSIAATRPSNCSSPVSASISSIPAFITAPPRLQGHTLRAARGPRSGNRNSDRRARRNSPRPSRSGPRRQTYQRAQRPRIGRRLDLIRAPLVCRETSRVSFLMCPFCVRATSSALATYLCDVARPATSGVTGRHRVTGYSRLRPGITGYSRHFFDPRTGCDRLRPAATRHSLCRSCVVKVMPTSTTPHVHLRWAEHRPPPARSGRAPLA
jgi:hypothetical protein